MSKSTRFASSVGIGKGKESTDGAGDMRGDVGREDARFIKRLLVDFRSCFDEDTVILRSGAREEAADATDLYPTASRTVGWGRMSMSVNGVELEEEKDPTLCRLSTEEGTVCCRDASAPSIVCVRGLYGACVCWGGLDSELSYEPPKASLNTMPCLLRSPPGIDRGDAWGDVVP